MTDATSGANPYSSNSNRDKQDDQTPEKKIEKVIGGAAKERKTPLSRRIMQNFTGADARSVGQYVLFDVVLPQIKDLIYDVGSSALQRSLFGDRGGGKQSYSSASRRSVGYTPYNAMSNAALPKSQPSQRAETPASDEFGEIVVPTRGDAEVVMERMTNLIDMYGMVTVSDLKTSVGITPTFTDEKFGWIGMGGTDIRRVGGTQPGFLLVFPRPEALQ